MRSLARTAAIVVPLGLLLYAAIEFLSQRTGAQYVLALALAGPLTVLLCWHVASSLRGGSIAVGRQAIARADHPVCFWLWILWEGVMTALLMALCLYAAGRLAGS